MITENFLANLTLEDVLLRELETAKQLTDILNREGTAIRERDAEALSAIAPAKLDALKTLEALEQARITHAPADSDSPSNDRTDGLWDRVIAVIRVCDRKNKLNGIMLRLRQETVKRAMDLMSDRDSSSVTYGSDGSTRSGTGPAGSWASA